MLGPKKQDLQQSTIFVKKLSLQNGKAFIFPFFKICTLITTDVAAKHQAFIKS